MRWIRGTILAAACGIAAAAGTVFFSFIGLDTIATAGEEVRNPKRNVPIGIIAALLLVTVFYMLVAMAAMVAVAAVAAVAEQVHRHEGDNQQDEETILREPHHGNLPVQVSTLPPAIGAAASPTRRYRV